VTKSDEEVLTKYPLLVDYTATE